MEIFLGSHHFLLIMKFNLLLNIRTPSVLARHLDENVNMFCALSSQIQNKHKPNMTAVKNKRLRKQLVQDCFERVL